MKPINVAIANYMAKSVPAVMWPDILHVLEVYQVGAGSSVTFTGTRELARHMDAIASIIDNRGVYDERIAQSGC